MEEASLAERTCVPCRKGALPLSAQAMALFLQQVKGWELLEAKALRKKLTAKNFLEAVDWIQKIAPIAESEDHHPDIHLTGYKHLTIELSTHAIGGLSENDFILAAKIDKLLNG